MPRSHPARVVLGALAALASGACVGVVVPTVDAEIVGDPLVAEQWALGNSGRPTIAGTIDGELRLSSDGTVARILGAGTPTPPVTGADLHTAHLRAATDGAGVVVAVIDTGVDVGHPELAGQLWTQPDGSGAHGWNAVDRTDDVRDAVGHGTAVAGIVAAARDGRGIEGVAPAARIMVVKVGHREHGLNLDDVALGITWAVTHGADVINLSLSADEAPQGLTEAIDLARRSGVIVVAAAGNAGTATSDLPGGLPGVIRVGAIGPDGRVPDFSNRNPDVVAPGVLTLTARASQTRCADVTPSLTTECELPDPTVVARTGTSFAAAHVAGVAALLRALHPDLTSDELEAALRASARDLDAPGPDAASGAGAVDADAAMTLLAERAPASSAPTAPLLRGAFVSQLIAMRSIPTEGISIAANLVFDAFSTPYALPVATAYARGIVRGRWFEPLRPVTRAEALTIVGRTVALPERATSLLVPSDIVLPEQRELVARSLAAGIGAPWKNRELNAPLTAREAEQLLRDLAAAELAGRVSAVAQQ